MRNTFGAKQARSWLMRFHTQTAGVSLTAQQPENNIVRVAIQALAAVLGGTQSLHTNSMDEALALPSELAVTIALRTQQIIAHESGVADTVDPLAGSYYIEYLTSELEKRILDLLDVIDQRGGSVDCIESGYFRDEIASSAYEHQKRIESEEAIVVGVNRFTSDNIEVPSTLRVDPRLEQAQVKALNKLLLMLSPGRLHRENLSFPGQGIHQSHHLRL